MAETAKQLESTLTEETAVAALTKKLDAIAAHFKAAKSVSFEHEGENQLRVTIETERLRLASCITSTETQEHYTALLSDPIVMEKNGHGFPYSQSVIADKINDYSSRWNHNIPFSALSIYEKDTEDDEAQKFVGTVILEESHLSTKPGTAILSYYLSPKYWNGAFKQQSEEERKVKQEWKGIGTEAVSAVVQDYAPELRKRDYKVTQLQWGRPTQQSFTSIDASVRKDNTGSWKILEKVGMTCVCEKEMFGNGLRKCYTKKI